MTTEPIEPDDFEVRIESTLYHIEKGVNGWGWWSKASDLPEERTYYATAPEALAAAAAWEEGREERRRERIAEEDADRRYGSYAEQANSYYYSTRI